MNNCLRRFCLFISFYSFCFLFLSAPATPSQVLEPTDLALLDSQGRKDIAEVCTNLDGQTLWDSIQAADSDSSMEPQKQWGIREELKFLYLDGLNFSEDELKRLSKSTQDQINELIYPGLLINDFEDKRNFEIAAVKAIAILQYFQALKSLLSSSNLNEKLRPQPFADFQVQSKQMSEFIFDTLEAGWKDSISRWLDTDPVIDYQDEDIFSEDEVFENEIATPVNEIMITEQDRAIYQDAFSQSVKYVEQELSKVLLSSKFEFFERDSLQFQESGGVLPAYQKHIALELKNLFSQYFQSIEDLCLPDSTAKSIDGQDFFPSIKATFDSYYNGYLSTLNINHLLKITLFCKYIYSIYIFIYGLDRTEELIREIRERFKIDAVIQFESMLALNPEENSDNITWANNWLKKLDAKWYSDRTDFFYPAEKIYEKTLLMNQPYMGEQGKRFAIYLRLPIKPILEINANKQSAYNQMWTEISDIIKKIGIESDSSSGQQLALCELFAKHERLYNDVNQMMENFFKQTYKIGNMFKTIIDQDLATIRKEDGRYVSHFYKLKELKNAWQKFEPYYRQKFEILISHIQNNHDSLNNNQFAVELISLLRYLMTLKLCSKEIDKLRIYLEVDVLNTSTQICNGLARMETEQGMLRVMQDKVNLAEEKVREQEQKLRLVELMPQPSTPDSEQDSFLAREYNKEKISLYKTNLEKAQAELTRLKTKLNQYIAKDERARLFVHKSQQMREKAQLAYTRLSAEWQNFISRNPDLRQLRAIEATQLPHFAAQSATAGF